MLSSNLISVIIPCYNGKKFIIDTIESVLNQTFINFEVIVVNDGSTDNSVELLQAFNDERISIINKPNSGVSDSRNLGLNNAQGEFIIFLDADDLLSDNFFGEAMRKFETNNNLDFLTVNIKQINEQGKQILNDLELRGTFENVQNEIVSFLPHVSTCPSAYIFRKNALIKHAIMFNKSLSSPADRYFLLQVGAHLKGGFIEKSYLRYRVHPNSMSHYKSEKLIIDQEIYFSHTLTQDILKSNSDVHVFKRKMAYQLFVDYLKMKRIKKMMKYGCQYLKTYF